MAISAYIISVIPPQSGIDLPANGNPLPPFALSLSKGFTFLQESKGPRHLSETGGSLKQGERRRANLDTMTLQTKVIIL
ncbi:hypothetical protein TomTYG75_31400 [Sphingobium sp. TomTYG75]